MRTGWQTRPLADLVKSRQGNNKIIKGMQSDKPGEGLIQGFSASGPDVWVATADYNQPGVVLSAVGARCGKTFMADGAWTAIANTHVLLPSTEIDHRWLWYFTNDESFWVKGGAAQPFVKVKETLQRPCKIPPLTEQQRMVGILDEAFDGIATAKINAEKNLQNIRALFGAYLQSVFTQRGDGWAMKPLGDVCDFLNGFAFKSGDAIPESKTQLVRMGNLYGNRLNLDRNPVFYPDSFAVDYQRYLLKEGDLIMSLTGTAGKEDYGYVVRIPDCGHDLLMNQRIAKFDSIRQDIINQDYLFYYLRSRAFLDILYPTANGTRQGNLSSVTIKTLPISLCSIGKQKAIATGLHDVAEKSQYLESIYQQKIDVLDDLKKSLLHHSFAGEL